MTEVRIARGERDFLLDPAGTYPLVLGPETSRRISSAYRALLDQGRDAAARELGAELLAVDAGLHPAQVLRAQTEFADGEHRRVADRLRPVVDELPTYSAARLLYGRALDLLGELPGAYDAYLGLSGMEAARLRSEALAPRVWEIVANRAQEAIRRGRLDDARSQVELLRSWAPGEPTTLETSIAVARAEGDAVAELASVRALAGVREPDRALLERRGDLEVEVGDPGRGLEIFRDLSARFPDDPTLADRLVFARFRWRLTLLPDRVQEVALKAELERGDYAVLLYWLVPSVRYGKAGRARIAGDILDDPRREEIARVINLGVMGVDATLHRFSPQEPLIREDALDSLLRVLAGARPPVACVRDYPARPSLETVCSTAERCGLLPDEAVCLASAPVAGSEALAAIRQGLELVGPQ